MEFRGLGVWGSGLIGFGAWDIWSRKLGNLTGSRFMGFGASTHNS